MANGTRYGSVYTRDTIRALRAVNELKAGLVYLNAPTIGSEIHLPFGGTKDTGNGHRESGTAAAEQFTETKTVFLDYSGTFSGPTSTSLPDRGGSGVLFSPTGGWIEPAGLIVPVLTKAGAQPIVGELEQETARQGDFIAFDLHVGPELHGDT